MCCGCNCLEELGEPLAKRPFENQLEASIVETLAVLAQPVDEEALSVLDQPAPTSPSIPPVSPSIPTVSPSIPPVSPSIPPVSPSISPVSPSNNQPKARVDPAEALKAFHAIKDCGIARAQSYRVMDGAHKKILLDASVKLLMDLGQ